MKIQYYLLLLVLLCFFSCKKNKEALLSSRQDDSLNVYFERANNDSLPFKVRYDSAKKAEDIVLKRPNDSMNRVNMFKVANRYYNIVVLRDYRRVVDKLINFSTIANDTLSLGKSYNYLSEYFIEKTSEDSAYLYIDMAEKLYIGQNDKSNICKTLLNKAMLKYTCGDYIGSEKPVFDVLRFLKMQNNSDPDIEYDAYNILGYVFDALGEFAKSLEYHNKALNIATTQFKSKNRIFTSLHNIGLLYQNNNDDEKAIEYFEKALGIDNFFLNTLSYGILLDNLGYSKFRQKRFDNIPNIFFESLRITDSFKSMPSHLSAKIHLSQYFSLKKDTFFAKSFVTEAYLVATKHQIQKYRLLSLKELISLDSKNIKEYSEKYIEITDSIQLKERQTRNKFARIEYETEELTLEKNNLIDQRKTILYISSCIFLILVLTLLFWYQKSKNRELVFIKEQQQANEEIYTLMLDQHQKLEEGKQFEKARIAKELHDGIMGRLSSIRLNLFVLEKKTDQTTIAKCIEHIHEIQEVEKEIKSIAYDLGNNLFSENISFETMVRKLFTAIENHSDINFKLFIDPKLDWEMVNSGFKIQIYRIFQEALQNIDKYANAKNVFVSIKQPDDHIEIEITDDGIGFEKKKIKKGFGLKNIKERAREMNGKVVIKSEKEKGTSILLIVPSTL